MADIITEIVGQEAFDQIDKLNKQLDILISKFNESAKSSLTLVKSLDNNAPISETKQKVAEVAKELENNVAVTEKAVRTNEDLVNTQKNIVFEIKKGQTAINEYDKAQLKASMDAERWANNLKKQATSQKQANAEQSTSIKLSKEGQAYINNQLRTLDKLIAKNKELEKAKRSENLTTSDGIRRIMALNEQIEKNNALIVAHGTKAQQQSANIGNYSGALGQIGKQATKAFSALRTLAYIIPGLGISGIMGIIADSVIGLAESMGILKTNTDDVTTSLSKLSDEMSTIDEQINESGKYIDRQTKLALSQARARGATVGELNDIEAKGIERRISLIKEELLAQTESIARQRQLLQLAESGSTSVKDKPSDIKKTISESEKKQQSLYQDLADLQIELEIKKNDKISDLNKDSLKKAKDLQKEKEKLAREAENRNTIPAIEAEYQREQNALEIRFKKAEITEEEYYHRSILLAGKFREERKGLNAKEIESQKNLNIKLEEIAVDYFNKLQKLNDLELQMVQYDAEKVAKIEEDRRKRQASFMEKYIKEDLERIKKYNEKQKEESEKYLKEQEQLEEALFNLKVQGIQAFQEISSTITERIMSDIEAKSDKEIEAIDLKEQRELEAIDRLSISEEEKEKRKKKVELEAEARRKKLERDKITDLRRYAIFQKGVDIASIITTTSLGVMKALSTTPPNPILAASIGIAGGTQLVKALATQIPQYEFGTPEGGHIGGKAQVGEAGTELGIRPDGTMFLTPSKTSIMDLPKRTHIIPHDLTKDLLGATMIRLAKTNEAVTLERYQDEMIEAFEKGTEKIANEIRRNRTNVSIGSDLRNYVNYKRL